MIRLPKGGVKKMPKNTSLIAGLLAILSIFPVACGQELSSLPYGKWESSNPSVTLDIGACYNGVYFGEYELNGKTVPLLIFGERRIFIRGYEASNFISDRYWEYVPTHMESYFDGVFRIKNGCLHYGVIDGEDMVFEKTEDRKEGPDTYTGSLEHALLQARPRGKWMSSNGTFGFDAPLFWDTVDGEIKGEYTASDGQVLELSIYFNTRENTVEAYERTDKSKVCFVGTYIEENGKLYFTLSDSEVSGARFPVSAEIVFEKVEDYEPPRKQTEYAHPGETWTSADPEISFNVDAEADWVYGGDGSAVPAGSSPYHFGTYTKDGESLDIVVRFGEDGRAFEIFDRKDYQFIGNEGRWYVVGMRPLFVGVCEQEDGKLRYTLMPPWRMLTGCGEIVFAKAQF
jgi:hypothetical protein